MSPEVDQILNVSAAQLAGTLAPMLPEGYAQGQGSLLSFMMVMCAREYERAADVRARENADTRALFALLSPRVTDGNLRCKLEAASHARDESLAVSDLNRSNAELRRLLIALQTHIEGQENSAGAQAQVWGVLRRSAIGRLVKLA